MVQIMEASHQWATRPADQRFLSLADLAEHVGKRKRESWTTAMRTADLSVRVEGAQLQVVVPDRTRGAMVALRPSHWSFGQMAQLAGAPASYLRKLPAELAAINAQWGLERMLGEQEGILAMAQSNGEHVLQALTSQTYGRIWDADVVKAVTRATEGGGWQVPAASYAAKDPKKATTLYASDRDVFVFLVDPTRPIGGEAEPLFRGFIASNSEVGSATFTLRTFLYRRVCDNRIIWGAEKDTLLSIRHTGGAPERFAYEGARLLKRYAEESATAIEATVTKARESVIGDAKPGTVRDWLKARGFTRPEAEKAVQAAQNEEGQARSVWDIVQGLTAVARDLEHTDSRVDLETRAGKLLVTVG
jgi:hypothetical protein